MKLNKKMLYFRIVYIKYQKKKTIYRNLLNRYPTLDPLKMLKIFLLFPYL